MRSSTLLFAIFLSSPLSAQYTASLKSTSLDADSLLPRHSPGLAPIKLTGRKLETQEDDQRDWTHFGVLAFGDTSLAIPFGIDTRRELSQIAVVVNERAVVLQTKRGQVLGSDAWKAIARIKTGPSAQSVRIWEIHIELDGSIAYVQPLDYMRGSLDIDGRKYAIALFRTGKAIGYQNPNLVYAGIDLDRDGSIRRVVQVDSTGRISQGECFRLDEPLPIDGKLWEISKISRNGTSLEITEATSVEVLLLNYPCPELQMKTLTEEIFSVPSRGNNSITVLNSWATWCSPCIQELPDLNRLVKKYSSEGVRFLAVAQNTEDEISSFLLKREFLYDQAVSDDRLGRLLGDRFPRHLVVDTKGFVIYDVVGLGPHFLDGLDLAIRKALNSD